jgi:hypothetical protein
MHPADDGGKPGGSSIVAVLAARRSRRFSILPDRSV